MNFRISKRQKEILKIVGKSALLASAIFAPNILEVLRPKNPKEKYYAKKSVQRLFDSKIIYLFGEEVRLTKEGQELLSKYLIEDVVISEKDEWDGVWHLVCYDIPEKKKVERDCFRNRLAEFHFYCIQDSLWAFPYECKEEIAIIAQYLGISPFVAYLNTDYLPQQNKLIRHFNLNQE